MTVYVLPKWERTHHPAFPSYDVTTSGAFRSLSPMLLGPVNTWGGYVSQNVENAWQFAKVYEGHLNPAGEIQPSYWDWASSGWSDTWAHRYPAGKGAKPAFTLWEGERLDYIEARRKVYIPLYSGAARETSAFKFLSREVEFGKDIVLRDFDAYEHRAMGYSWEDVINDPTRKMGHGFVLAMMLEGYL